MTNSKPERPNQITLRTGTVAINWITTNLGQAQISDPGVIGSKKIVLVFWSGAGNSVDLFTPSDSASTIIANSLFCLAGEVQAMNQRFAMLTAVLTKIKAELEAGGQEPKKGAQPS